MRETESTLQGKSTRAIVFLSKNKTSNGVLSKALLKREEFKQEFSHKKSITPLYVKRKSKKTGATLYWRMINDKVK